MDGLLSLLLALTPSGNRLPQATNAADSAKNARYTMCSAVEVAVQLC